MSRTELDLTFKKVSELEAGESTIVGTDRLLLVRDGGVITRPASDIDGLPTIEQGYLAYRAVSLSELNEDKTLIEGVEGKSILINDIHVFCDGSFGDLTSAIIQDEDDNAIFTMAQAEMSDKAHLFKGEDGVTLGDDFGTLITQGKDVEIVVDGDAATGGTNLIITISYALVSIV